MYLLSLLSLFSLSQPFKTYKFSVRQSFHHSTLWHFLTSSIAHNKEEGQSERPPKCNIMRPFSLLRGISIFWSSSISSPHKFSVKIRFPLYQGGRGETCSRLQSRSGTNRATMLVIYWLFIVYGIYWLKCCLFNAWHFLKGLVSLLPCRITAAPPFPLSVGPQQVTATRQRAFGPISYGRDY